mmetsp:Transcript_7174/g.11317  ORF Transcript_7174/g.11317 Transcript_7174/m.11317 type:complete len:167 (+) Transcript_7174:276-776(+)
MNSLSTNLQNFGHQLLPELIPSGDAPRAGASGPFQMNTSPTQQEPGSTQVEGYIERGDPDLPNYYNFREAHPECPSQILDQGSCGACWSFTAVGSLEDRLCLKSGGEIKVQLSPQDVIDCAFGNYGCEGGYMIPAFDFLISEGASLSSCVPYGARTGKCALSCSNE